LLPIAFGLFDKENNISWERFMKFVRRKVIGSRVVCIISDMHHSILRVFKELNFGWHTKLELVYHRFLKSGLYNFRHASHYFKSF
jgi:hypothetical protein